MRSPTRIVSTRRRWRLFRPWIEKPCSRVLRKLSGELTIIQNCAALAPPDLRFRRDRPDLGGRSGSAAGSSLSDTSRRLLAVQAGAAHRGQGLRLREQRAEVADLRDVAHLMPRHQPADLEQRHVAAPRIGNRAFPLSLAPAMEEVDRTAPDPCEILEGLLKRPGQVLVVARIDARADIGILLAVEVGVSKQRVDLGCGVDQMGDQAAEGGEGRAMAVTQPRLV